MDTNGLRLSQLMGELIAYRVTMDILISTHPGASLLHDRLRIAEESGTAVILGRAEPDEMLDAFQRAMNDIVRMLPTLSTESVS